MKWFMVQFFPYFSMNPPSKNFVFLKHLGSLLLGFRTSVVCFSACAGWPASRTSRYKFVTNFVLIFNEILSIIQRIAYVNLFDQRRQVSQPVCSARSLLLLSTRNSEKDVLAPL